MQALRVGFYSTPLIKKKKLKFLWEFYSSSCGNAPRRHQTWRLVPKTGLSHTSCRWAVAIGSSKLLQCSSWATGRSTRSVSAVKSDNHTRHVLSAEACLEPATAERAAALLFEDPLLKSGRTLPRIIPSCCEWGHLMRPQDTRGQTEIDQVLMHLGKTKMASARKTCSIANKSPTFSLTIMWLFSDVFIVSTISCWFTCFHFLFLPSWSLPVWHGWQSSLCYRSQH